MHLSTACENCGENVVVAVPAWMTDAMEQATAVRHGEGECEKEGEWREGFVGTAVGVAKAIKASPVRFPHLTLLPMWAFELTSVWYVDPGGVCSARKGVVSVRVVPRWTLSPPSTHGRHPLCDPQWIDRV
jgi:hypothetical protein